MMSTLQRSSGSARRRLLRTAAVATVAMVPLACGEPDEQSLCPVFDEFVEARTAIRSVDATAETAEAIADEVREYLAVIQRLRQNADGRYVIPIDALTVAVADVLRTLESVDDEADYSIWAPLVEESVVDANVAADRVEDLITPQCETET